MRTLLAMAVAVSLVAGTLSVASGADEKKSNPQQERMKACNALWPDSPLVQSSASRRVPWCHDHV